MLLQAKTYYYKYKNNNVLSKSIECLNKFATYIVYINDAYNFKKLRNNIMYTF